MRLLGRAVRRGLPDRDEIGPFVICFADPRLDELAPNYAVDEFIQVYGIQPDFLAFLHHWSESLERLQAEWYEKVYFGDLPHHLDCAA